MTNSQSEERFVQKCPVCEGRGVVGPGFYPLVGGIHTCLSCSGTGIITKSGAYALEFGGKSNLDLLCDELEAAQPSVGAGETDEDSTR